MLESLWQCHGVHTNSEVAPGFLDTPAARKRGAEISAARHHLIAAVVATTPSQDRRGAIFSLHRADSPPNPLTRRCARQRLITKCAVQAERTLRCLQTRWRGERMHLTDFWSTMHRSVHRVCNRIGGVVRGHNLMTHGVSSLLSDQGPTGLWRLTVADGSQQ
jgi:hypothetical protein